MVVMIMIPQMNLISIRFSVFKKDERLTITLRNVVTFFLSTSHLYRVSLVDKS